MRRARRERSVKPTGTAMGARLRALRVAHKLTQWDVGQAIHATPAQVSEYERGAVVPRLTALVRLADLYEVTTDYLLGRR